MGAARCGFSETLKPVVSSAVLTWAVVAIAALATVAFAVGWLSSGDSTNLNSALSTQHVVESVWSDTVHVFSQNLRVVAIIAGGVFTLGIVGVVQVVLNALRAGADLAVVSEHRPDIASRIFRYLPLEIGAVALFSACIHSLSIHSLLYLTRGDTIQLGLHIGLAVVAVCLLWFAALIEVLVFSA